MKLALGTAQFGMDYGIANQSGKVARAEVVDILRLAWESGIDTLDTAIAYGCSEQCLGQAGVDGWKIVTKLPPVPDDCADVEQWARQQLTGSLDRLQVSQLHAVLLHRAEDLIGPHGTRLVDALMAMQHEGLTDRMGVSIYTPDLLPELFARVHLDLVQAPFNVVDRRLQESGWLAELKRRGSEVHVRSAFMQGLLLMSRADRPAKFSPWDGLWNRWHGWLESEHRSAVAACLGFLRSFPEIDRIVVGIDRVDQLAELVAVSDEAGLRVPGKIQSRDKRLLDPSSWRYL